jgi:hypothetical protein
LIIENGVAGTGSAPHPPSTPASSETITPPPETTVEGPPPQAVETLKAWWGDQFDQRYEAAQNFLGSTVDEGDVQGLEDRFPGVGNDDRVLHVISEISRGRGHLLDRELTDSIEASYQGISEDPAVQKILGGWAALFKPY